LAGPFKFPHLPQVSIKELNLTATRPLLDTFNVVCISCVLLNPNLLTAGYLSSLSARPFHSPATASELPLFVSGISVELHTFPPLRNEPPSWSGLQSALFAFLTTRCGILGLRPSFCTSRVGNPSFPPNFPFYVIVWRTLCTCLQQALEISNDSVASPLPFPCV